MNYGYVRVSSSDQNIIRQMVSLQLEGLTQDTIYIDKQSGKNFDRDGYRKMKSQLKQGDCLFIHSLDRFGRNYDEIIKEWREITMDIKADIVVLDMPLLDTREKTNGLIGRFISDLVLQVLSFVAETERINIKDRQSQGIEQAKARGVKFGRPSAPMPDNWEEVCLRFKDKEIDYREAVAITGIPISIFYYKYNQWLSSIDT